MADTKSVPKYERSSERRHQRNKSIRSEVKTNITRAEKLIFSGKADEAKEAVTAAISSLDKAAEKKVIHGNNAARRKSRLMKKLNTTLASPKAEPEKAK